MSSSKRRLVPAILAGAVVSTGALGAAARGQAADPGLQELKAQNEALMARIERLESGQQQQRDRQAVLERDVVDATVKSVLTDADKRSQYLAPEGFTAGYDAGKFLIQSADGSFVLNPSLQLQVRHITNFRQDSKNVSSEDVQNGFELRRAKFAFDGNIFGKQNVFKAQWATGRNGGAVTLEEFWLKHSFGEDFGGFLSDFAVKLGQFKDPVFHEEITSSKRQLAVERSLPNLYLGGQNTKYEQGISFIYDPKESPIGAPVRAEFGYVDGGNTSNTNFTDTGGLPGQVGLANAQYGFFGRVEAKLSGDWKAYDDFSGMKTTTDLLVVGGGAHLTGANNGEALFHTVDVQWEPASLVKGLGVYAAYYGALLNFNEVDDDVNDSPYHFGLLAQAGYMLNNEWEVFGRYGYIDFDGGPGGAGTFGAASAVTDSVHEITAGVNYFFHGHNSKVTADLTWLPNGAPISQDGAGILGQPSEDDQIVVRVQYQILL